VVAVESRAPQRVIPHHRPISLAGLPSLILAGAMAVFLAMPLIGLVQRALLNGGMLEAMRRPIVLEAVRLSLLTTVIVLALALVFGSPLALVLARRRFRGIILLDSLVDLPIVLPPAVAAAAATLGRRGRWAGCSRAWASGAFHHRGRRSGQFRRRAVLRARRRSGFLAVPREYEEAARVEGCDRVGSLLLVTAPIAAPGPVRWRGPVLGARTRQFGATIMFAVSSWGGPRRCRWRFTPPWKAISMRLSACR
jgi:molybdate transport system permease protein